MSSIRLSGTSSGYYDLTVPAVAGTNSIDLSTLPSKTNLGTSSITHGSNTGDTRFTLNSANQYTLRIQNAGNIAGQIGGGGADDLRFSNAAGATTMQIKDGRVTMPNQPAWFGTHADNYATTWSGGQVFNMVANTGNSYNVGNHFDFSTERFTAPVAGHYLVFGWDIRENGREATGVGLGVYKNGLGSSNRVVSSYHQNQRGYAFSSVISLAVNDWISFGVTEGGGVAGLFYGSGTYSGYGIRLLG